MPTAPTAAELLQPIKKGLTAPNHQCHKPAASRRCSHPGDIIPESRATSCRNTRATSSESAGLPGSDLLDELWLVGDAAVETLGGEDTEIGFRQIEPAAMFGSVVELETFGEPSCFRGGEGFIE